MPSTPIAGQSAFGKMVVGAIEGVIVRPLCTGEELDPDCLLTELVRFLSMYQRGDPASGAAGGTT